MAKSGGENKNYSSFLVGIIAINSHKLDEDSELVQLKSFFSRAFQTSREGNNLFSLDNKKYQEHGIYTLRLD